MAFLKHPKSSGNLFSTDVFSSSALYSQDEEISMLGEVTHLQAISDDLKALTSDPHKLPPASEQVREMPRVAKKMI